MKQRYYDSIGKEYGKLRVERVYEGKDKSIYCDCICECGNEKKGILYTNLERGKTSSCGCKKREYYERKKAESMDRYREYYDRIDSGEKVAVVAREIGVSRQTLSSWYNKYLRSKR